MTLKFLPQLNGVNYEHAFQVALKRLEKIVFDTDMVVESVVFTVDLANNKVVVVLDFQTPVFVYQDRSDDNQYVPRADYMPDKHQRIPVRSINIPLDPEEARVSPTHQ